MFGNAPKALWSRWCPPDELGRIGLACRALLVEDGARRILLETGIGSFFEPKLKERYGVVDDGHVLLRSLDALGLSHEDIDAVVLSHLHFDHAGGLLAAYEPGSPHRLLFPNATFLTGRGAWQRARAPHPRDRASFIEGLCDLLEASGRLVLIEDDAETTPVLGERLRFTRSSGHTPGMLHTTLGGRASSMFFCADLVPGVPWVRLPITMGYDRFPEQLIDEKRATFERLARDGAWLFFTHDEHHAAGRLEAENGGYAVRDRKADFTGWDLDVEPS